jgi:general secretion pathway protein B
MSFILDALKKSEVERQRQTVPGLMDAGRVPPRRRIPLWAAALGALLGVNLIVLAGLLLRHESAAPAVGPVPATNGARTASSAATSMRALAPEARATLAGATKGPAATPSAQGPDHFSPMDGTPTYAPEIPLAAGDVASAAPALGQKPLRHPAAPSSQAPQLSDEPDEILPTLGELNLTGADALPELHLDVHVWATLSADRFVYINSRKYREGAHLQEGPTVERIRRDGVVLNSQGTRFLLPRDQ